MNESHEPHIEETTTTPSAVRDFDPHQNIIQHGKPGQTSHVERKLEVT